MSQIQDPNPLKYFFIYQKEGKPNMKYTLLMALE